MALYTLHGLKKAIFAVRKMSNKTENIENTEEPEMQEDELFVQHRFEVDKGQEPLRIDKYIMNFVAFTSRSKIQQAAKAGCLKVNDKVVKSNYRVRPNDKITVLMANPIREKEILGEDIPLDIRYEDDDLLVLMKPAGMVRVIVLKNGVRCASPLSVAGLQEQPSLNRNQTVLGTGFRNRALELFNR